ncbi:MAG: ABATE domain-containing protein [Propionibacteriales bacterium]|nr:ABATE domain-containing protein [Propionibacteriales bacterium]
MTTTTEWVEDHFVAGHLALDFANTVYRRWPEPGPELLVETADLAGWLALIGLVPDSEPGVDEAALEDARALRALLWRVFDAHIDDRSIPASALAGLLGTARRPTDDLTLHADGSTTAQTVQGSLAIVALRAIALLLDPPPQGVRACDRCGWFFIDSSRGRRRRWCSMKTCGNQAKAARFRSTHA